MRETASFGGKLRKKDPLLSPCYTYRQGYTLIGFDVDPTTSPDFRYVGKPREGHTKLEIRFKKGLPAPVTVILYATFPEIMTIDQARNVRLEIKDKFAQRRERN